MYDVWPVCWLWTVDCWLLTDCVCVLLCVCVLCAHVPNVEEGRRYPHHECTRECTQSTYFFSKNQIRTCTTGSTYFLVFILFSYNVLLHVVHTKVLLLCTTYHYPATRFCLHGYILHSTTCRVHSRNICYGHLQHWTSVVFACKNTWVDSHT